MIVSGSFLPWLIPSWLLLPKTNPLLLFALKEEGD
jgi:hypothetical protein